MRLVPKGKLRGDFHGHNSFRIQEVRLSDMKRTVKKIERIRKKESKVLEIKSKKKQKTNKRPEEKLVVTL